ncbi:MAG TPA: alanine--glyoxylate aminotransferase family protein [Halobacteriales archaeon]|uniref:pyridoxal-phosphate-dependent aminotransferase family protein n=1 Tax=Candidatus Hikarchaeum yamanae TaxID=2675326 RepID=UPI00183F314A|nr:alanine--glyoxylate aminotransferase family protein [Halobacteriales archaeon]|tara:strand:+ start:14233 stop:15399 length:1167 start_codon:yes stop_codon:yes gene_type:complete
MAEDFLMLNPGPVPLSKNVREEMARTLVSHRSPEFAETYQQFRDGLDYVFRHSTIDGRSSTDNGMSIPLMGTATMGMESAIINLAGPKDEVVALDNGKFGERFVDIADRNCLVKPIRANWGDSFDMESIKETITSNTHLVAMVHQDTSTGIMNPIKEVGEIAKENGAFFVVDGVSSIGGDEFKIDEWGVDVVVADAQKALASPPGISAIFATEHALESFDNTHAGYYQDLPAYVKTTKQNKTPFTSAVTLVRAFVVALENIKEEGIQNRISRHRTQALANRTSFMDMGLPMFPNLYDHSDYSNTVTVVNLPDPISGNSSDFFKAMKQRNVSASGGHAHLKNQILRMSNMGDLSTAQVLRGIQTVGEALCDCGINVDTDSALDIAEKIL